MWVMQRLCLSTSDKAWHQSDMEGEQPAHRKRIEKVPWPVPQHLGLDFVPG